MISCPVVGAKRLSFCLLIVGLEFILRSVSTVLDRPLSVYSKLRTLPGAQIKDLQFVYMHCMAWGAGGASQCARDASGDARVLARWCAVDRCPRQGSHYGWLVSARTRLATRPVHRQLYVRFKPVLPREAGHDAACAAVPAATAAASVAVAHAIALTTTTTALNSLRSCLPSRCRHV